MPANRPLVGQGKAVIADAYELEKDAAGFTHPNLHRRIVDEPLLEPDGVVSKSYELEIQGLDSYRAVHTAYHNEEETNADGSPNEDETP